jgi:hypothetical protein
VDATWFLGSNTMLASFIKFNLAVRCE